MRLRHTLTDFEIDLARPVEAGESIARLTVLPALVAVESQLGREDALRLWAGALSSIVGSLGAAVGPAAAVVLLETLQTLLPGASTEAKKGMH